MQTVKAYISRCKSTGNLLTHYTNAAGRIVASGHSERGKYILQNALPPAEAARLGLPSVRIFRLRGIKETAILDCVESWKAASGV